MLKSGHHYASFCVKRIVLFTFQKKLHCFIGIFRYVPVIDHESVYNLQRIRQTDRILVSTLGTKWPVSALNTPNILLRRQQGWRGIYLGYNIFTTTTTHIFYYTDIFQQDKMSLFLSLSLLLRLPFNYVLPIVCCCCFVVVQEQIFTICYFQRLKAL